MTPHDSFRAQLSDSTRQRFDRVARASEYAADVIARGGPAVRQALDAGNWDQRPGLAAISAPIAACRALTDPDQAMGLLRQHRHQHLAGIIWRDLLNLTTTDETLNDLTRLATALIRAAWHVARNHQRQSTGVLRDPQGAPIELVVLGMGKLGGGELNLSSDIDLIFAYRCEGESDGRRALSAEAYMRKQAQTLIKCLGENTGNGFCYRVDTRLRPHGSAGRLALSFDAMETYYQREGRDWERYALIKAYPSAGPRQDGLQLLQRLRPFVFRRYIDFTTFAAIRAMKREIRASYGDGSLDRHIKLGPGGIREIEFITQGLQLVRGGREPALRQRPLRHALAAAVDSGLLGHSDAEQLLQAYGVLRDVENRLQAWRDQQTHDLPADGDADGWQRLADSMGQTPGQLRQQLQQHRDRVHELFGELFDEAERAPAADSQWEKLWHGDDAPSSLPEWQGLIHRFRDQANLRQASRSDRERLDAFLPIALQRLHQAGYSSEVLRRLLALVTVTIRRSAYLALLIEHPAALDRLLTVLSLSERMSQWLAEHPILLDELLDERVLSGGDPSLPDLPDAEATDEIEQVLIRLAEYRQAVRLRLAVQTLLSRRSAEAVSQRLTALAEIVVEQVLLRAEAQLAERHGRAPAGGVAVIGYGRLGSTELGFDSDLDLVCIHPDLDGECATDGERPLDASIFYRRTVQRLMSWLHGHGPAGRLFEVDMRLRPNGNSGLLVSSLRAYQHYQQSSAWVWEQQALVRARFIAGNPAVGEAFEQTRREQLCQPRDPAPLLRAVDDMRLRLQSENAAEQGSRGEIKFMPGGMLELEFLLQALVLRHAFKHPALTVPRDGLGLIRALHAAQLIDSEEESALAQAWQVYHRLMQWRELHAEHGDEPELQAYRQQVSDIRGKHFADAAPAS
jgi:glutamate-ammonia-ligase adenylyltransferase